MHVKHGGQGHVDVVRPESDLGVVGADGDGAGKGVQHELAVGEEDTLGIAGGARSVEGGGTGVFVQIRERVADVGGGQEFLVLRVYSERGLGLLTVVADEDHLLHGGELVPDRLEQL